MSKDLKKYLVVIGQSILTFILFACNFTYIKMKFNSTWWVGESVSGYKLIGSLKNFIGTLFSIFSVVIIIVTIICLIVALFGILNSMGKTKLEIGKIPLSLILKWILFINLCLIVLNVLWSGIVVATLNGKYADTIFKYGMSFTPFLLAIISGLSYILYCVYDGKFIWVKNFWDDLFDKSKNKSKKVKKGADKKEETSLAERNEKENISSEEKTEKKEKTEKSEK